MPNYDCGSPECMTCEDAFRRGKSDGSSPDGSSLPATREGEHTPDLLPCPFCGCDQIAVYYDAPESVGAPLAGFYISHPLWKQYPETWGCRVQLPGTFSSEAEAVGAWNRRAAPETAAERDRLREALVAIVEFCDDPDGSENPETLAMGLARLLPAARTALQHARSPETNSRN